MTATAFAGTVAVVGLGYIGLPTAVTLASHGVQVTGVDVNEETVCQVARGELPFAEPGLGISLSGVVSRGLLTATTQMPDADAYVIAVPTPFNGDHSADLTYIDAAADALAPHLRPGVVVVLESTSPPGTTEKLSRMLAAARPDLTFPHDQDEAPDVSVAHCPERVLPGRIMTEMVMNDRVIGGLSDTCAERAAEIYQTFCQGEIQLCDAPTAEMAKLVENSYRDVNIAFANELSMICERLGLDVWEVIRMANRHPRVEILQPGPGVGGHCIAVDPWFIVGAAPDDASLIRTAREVNDRKPHRVTDTIVARASRFRDPVIACLGLTFKANVDDVRESPSIEIVHDLAQRLPGARILAVDPYIKTLPEEFSCLDNVEMCSARPAIAAADVVVVLVDHQYFKRLPTRILEGKVLCDIRGMWR